MACTAAERPGFDYESVCVGANFLLGRTQYRPLVGIVCGSGLGGLAEELKNPDVFPYEEIPNFPVTTVPGHDGKMVFGLLGSVPVMCMKGRFHHFEGYPMWKTAAPIRLMKQVGVRSVLMTNASGGLNQSYSVGDMMVIRDHINVPGFSGNSPLIGANDDEFGPRFLGMANAYDQHYRKAALDVCAQMGIGDHVHEGVYMMVPGPCYETVAESRLLRSLGGDAVGMSTVAEVITARHCGLRVFALSLITNKCIVEWDTNTEPCHEEVVKAANARKHDLQKMVTRLVAIMAEA